MKFIIGVPALEVGLCGQERTTLRFMEFVKDIQQTGIGQPKIDLTEIVKNLVEHQIRSGAYVIAPLR